MNKSHTNESWSEYMRDYRKRNPDKMKNIDLKKRFNITLDQYKEMLALQDNVCAICLQPEKRKDHRTGLIRELAVDHCHTTGKIRGLLCTDCNTALGLFKDNP
ncbi:MAG TPA: endonuclease VII domain-containing protein [Methanosarcina sp.]|nr:endonuclease VII domain-containing protein [Methanosarcina sp.]